MSKYTPTTESIMAAYIADGGWTAEDRAAQFDRWHADVIRKAKADAWEEGLLSAGLDPDYTMQIMSTNPYAEES